MCGLVVEVSSKFAESSDFNRAYQQSALAPTFCGHSEKILLILVNAIFEDFGICQGILSFPA